MARQGMARLGMAGMEINKNRQEHDMTDRLEWEDATPVDFLYLLRNEAGKAADRLSKQVIEMRKALGEAETVLDRLNELADGAQDAAELVYEATKKERLLVETTTLEDHEPVWEPLAGEITEP